MALERTEDKDFVILITTPTEEMRESTLVLLNNYGLRYNVAIFGILTGERICINDKKPSGLLTSYAVNVLIDQGLSILKVIEDPNLSVNKGKSKPTASHFAVNSLKHCVHGRVRREIFLP
jgi:hypothetical protein